MQFNQLWIIIVKKNQNLERDIEVKMTVNGFKKALRLAYDKGYEHGSQESYGQAGSEVNNLFGTLFGRH